VKFGDKVQENGQTRYYCMVSGDDQVYQVGDMVMQDLPEDVDELKVSENGGEAGGPSDISGMGSGDDFPPDDLPPPPQ
jgi:hypothetical protein